MKTLSVRGTPGERTLAVLTKPDLVDDGAEDEVAEVLANKRKPLRLGFAMVRCRNQRELDSQSSLQDAHFQRAQPFKARDFCRILPSVFVCLRAGET